ncbi:uncharacterized protein MELLADRAFT_107147 [Melampsora larici-populina 98AG31]|uniref:Secreted protein n=1 Tax=Melampsora larici-populina (strain 98AG31 / pathotype 3-4-7) TaxID=747676 RepID=F4RP03_MELLP|nr:uncharacterized protein MELLADRAFT_107147 [Melampsora larici-populina 98AG31]EGG05737.1 hypothetical protein MELLADRAFT_107147 [Melampsora larici-populina 98AG31]
MLQLNFLVFCLFVSLFIFDQTFTLPAGLDTPSAELNGVTPTMNMKRRSQLDEIVQGVGKIKEGEEEEEHTLQKSHDMDQDQKKEESVGVSRLYLGEESEKEEHELMKRDEGDQKTELTQQEFDPDTLAVPNVEKRHEGEQNANHQDHENTTED